MNAWVTRTKLHWLAMALCVLWCVLGLWLSTSLPPLLARGQWLRLASMALFSFVLVYAGLGIGFRLPGARPLVVGLSALLVPYSALHLFIASEDKRDFALAVPWVVGVLTFAALNIWQVTRQTAPPKEGPTVAA